VRLLPSAKVCFLGGCPQSGRNQNLYRRNSEAEDRCAAGRSLCSLAVLESDGRKRTGSSEEQCGLWVVRRRGEKLGTERTFGLSHDWRSIRATGAYARQSALGLLPLGGDSESRERRASRRGRKRPQDCGPRKRPAEKKFAYRRGESEPVLRANLRAAYWLPAAGLPALRMEEAATKMRAAL
jgi:hypothetical protein